KEIGRFVDQVLKAGPPLATLGPLMVAEGHATASIDSRLPIVKVQIHSTTDTGPWQSRAWTSGEAKIEGESVVADLPAGRPLVVFLTATDETGAVVSTEHVELPADHR